jgi:hypothetical protein
MRDSNKLRSIAFIVVLGAAAFPASFALAQGPNPHGLYVPPANSFIQDSAETRIALTLGSTPLAQVQTQLDSARAGSDSPIVLTLTGTYLVANTPLTLPSNTSLVLYGTIKAVPGARASSLIAITDQTRVSVAGGLLDGQGANLSGIDVETSAKINIDAVTITNTGGNGIVFNGNGNDVWDSGSAITRCEISNAGGDGIAIGSLTQGLILDSFVHDNKGAGIRVVAASSSVVNNVIEANDAGIDADGNDDLISDNALLNNRNSGLILGRASANTAVLRNSVAGNANLGIDLSGANNLLYANKFENGADLAERTTGNWVVPRGAPLNAPLSSYFYPPTISNEHTDPIMNRKSRTDLLFGSMSITDLQAAYDASRQAHPNDVVVLHLNGTFTVDTAPLVLASNTAVILNGTINMSTTATATNVITTQNPVQFVSLSGGTVDCSGKRIEAVHFLSQTMASIDHVTIGNCGPQSPRSSNSNLLHLANGSGYNIVDSNTLNGGGARGIWTQSSSSRYIVLNNHVSNVNQDGVDFDSSTSHSVAAGNVSENNLRYGVFIEQSDSFDKVYGNSTTTRGLSGSTGHGVGVYNNATSSSTRGITDKNTVFSNSSDVINNGLRVGSIATASGGVAETAHSFLFNNVATNSTGDGILFDTEFPRSVQNYFSQTVLSGNKTDIDSHPSDGATPPEFFNPPSAIDLALRRTVTASSSAPGSSPDAAVDGLSYTNWTAGSESQPWLTIDLGSDVSFQRAMLKQTTTPGIRLIVLQSSEDGVNFTDIPGTAHRIGMDRVNNVSFSPVTARFLRVQVQTILGGPVGFEECSVQPN